MLGVHQQAGKLVLISLQSEQNAQPHIVNAALHGTIHCLGVIVIVMLRPCRMHGKITLFMIGFLKQNIGTDAGIFQLSVVFHGGCRNVDIDAPNVTVLVMHGVDGMNAV